MILAALAFALSTDYGMFLLARISEARAPGATEREVPERQERSAAVEGRRGRGAPSD